LAIWTLLVSAAIAGHAAAKDEWASPYFRDHPLAGTIWTADFQAVTLNELEDSVANARFVVLGEIHNNPDHHRLQARLIEALVKKGRRPAVVFEMIPTDLQAELDRHADGGVSEAGKLGKALRWEERGWPAWAIYRPLAEAALQARLPLLAGGLDKDTQKLLAKGEPSPIYTQTMKALGLAEPLKPEIAEAERHEIEEAHCNLLPPAAMEPMVRVQRAVDASLAKAMVSTNARDGAALIAGAGHGRKDWAVPHMIHERVPGAIAVSIAFIEVDPEHTTPSQYMNAVPGLEKPFDFIYLTPRAELTGDCAGIEKHLKEKKARKTGKRQLSAASGRRYASLIARPTRGAS
jgi:uncharacterized iron-regulated protein